MKYLDVMVIMEEICFQFSIFLVLETPQKALQCYL